MLCVRVSMMTSFCLVHVILLIPIWMMVVFDTHIQTRMSGKVVAERRILKKMKSRSGFNKLFQEMQRSRGIGERMTSKRCMMNKWKRKRNKESCDNWRIGESVKE